MASPNRGSNSSASSSSPVPGAPGAPRFFLRPRTVEHYLHNFKVSLEDFFNTQNPGQIEDYYLIGDFVVPRNKRNIIIYVAHEPLGTAQQVSRIYYTLPVNPIYAPIFDEDIEPGETLPSAGPLLHTFNIPVGYSATTFVDAIIADVATGPEEGRLASWTSEIARMRTIGETAGESFSRRRAANKIIHFWTPMRKSILDILHEVGIKIHNDEGRLPSPWRSPAAVITPAASPVLPVRSSSASRRRRSSQRRRRATRRRTTSDPTNLRPKNIYNVDPVTGKRVRRRRAESDPRNDAI
jgi:hypothetical protein